MPPGRCRAKTGAIAFFLSGYDRAPTRTEIAKYLRDRDENCAASVQLPDGTVIGNQSSAMWCRAPRR